MKPKNETGFTIIETMLFLGITGLMVVGILAGTGVSINIQRYRDSVSSLQSILQQQFSEVLNVSNGSSGNLACYDKVPIAKGQSDCVLLGRFITTDNNSKTLLIKNVIGLIPNNTTVSSNDIEALAQYSIKTSPVSGDDYNIPWDAAIVQKGSNSAMSFSMLIVRSPLSGVVRSFVSIDSPPIADIDVKNLVNKTALAQSAKLCVSSNGLFTGVKSAVVVMADATGSSSIETQGEISGC